MSAWNDFEYRMNNKTKTLQIFCTMRTNWCKPNTDTIHRVWKKEVINDKWLVHFERSGAQPVQYRRGNQNGMCTKADQNRAPRASHGFPSCDLLPRTETYWNVRLVDEGATRQVDVSILQWMSTHQLISRCTCTAMRNQCYQIESNFSWLLKFYHLTTNQRYHAWLQSLVACLHGLAWNNQKPWITTGISLTVDWRLAHGIF